MSSASARFRWIAVAMVLGGSVLLSFSAPKTIRLRNEIISTEKRPAQATKGPAETAHSGLFLIQLTGPIEAEWKTELERRDIRLVRYLPDHAFIAWARGARLQDLEPLAFVQWTGSLRPEHKIHQRVAARGKADAGADADVPVSILLDVAASPQELAGARGVMKQLASESTSRFGHVWRGVIHRSRLTALAQSDAVLWIEPGPRIRLFDETAAKIIGGESLGHATHVQSLGYDGTGVVIAVADSGLDAGTVDDLHPDLFGRVDAFFFYGQLTDASDEHSHGTHVAGIIAGNGATGEIDDYGALWGLGVAPASRLVIQRLFDGDGNYEAPPSFESMTRDAVRAGADIGSNSWGDDTQGRYDISAAEFDALVRDADFSASGDQPYILEFSAGNAGPGGQTIGSPAVAKNVIASGASQNDRGDYFIYADGPDAMADFSSRGPAEDGRIKPDVVAPGTWIASLRSSMGNDDFAWADISSYYMFQGGTSQSGPHVSGAAALFVQYYRALHTNATPSPALVKAALINSATDMADEIETGPVPNFDEGWGRVDLVELLDSERTYEFVDQSVLLTTGQQYEHRVVVIDPEQPLYVTLTYTDVPGFPGAVPALVNDLDLVVIGPDGAVYHGNHFHNGESVPDLPGFDAVNNVECVFLGAPMAGEYIMQIRARNVAEDARAETFAVDQDFALVVSAATLAPGESIVLMDRTAYTAPARIQLKVIDRDLAAQPGVAVRVSSDTEPSGFTVNLNYSGVSGTFTGSVAVAAGPAVNDAIIQVAHGNLIRAEYLDPSSASTRTAIAQADLVPPIVSGVTPTTDFGQTAIQWITDERANSIVLFGTNSVLNRAATNRIYTVSHSVRISNLVPGRTYYFAVVSTDIAGNTTTNDNGGNLFSLVASAAPTVLLVDNYLSDGFDLGPDIPLSTYTEALDAIGASYDVWDLAGGAPSPTVDDLRPYRVVMWRLSDNIFLGDTITPQEQLAIQEYLAGGGSFFMASMEQLSRLNNIFRRDVLQVAEFAEDATASEAWGLFGNPITAGVEISLDYSNYETESYQLFGVPADISDTFTPGTNAAPILIDAFGEIVGLASPPTGTDQAGRVVFLSFPWDAVPADDAAPNNRAELLRRILEFLAPGEGGIGAVALNNNEFTLPSVVAVEVADTDLIAHGTITAHVSSATDPAGFPLTLTETIRGGVFRGSFALVANTGASTLPQLRASPNDWISVSYFDTSRNVSVVATGVVEVIPPIITQVEAEPDYVEANVTWLTDEPTDALVQYGESLLLGQTAYVPLLHTSHAVTVRGLQPDRLYYYKVVSRDNAGNVTEDNNGGALYTFRTLQPFNVGWSDDFEEGQTKWTVYTADESESGWTYGSPPSGESAHSGSRVWGTNLGRDPIGFVQSFLISPPIYLDPNAGIPKLRFWQNYDFLEGEDDLLHYGEVMIITNTAVEPVSLGFISDDISGGWEAAEYDLAPYRGQLVHLVWHYIYFSFDYNAHLGWMIDDVSVSVGSGSGLGTIRVTNNLSQAGFAVTGPQNFTGRGNFLIVTSAPPGEYVVTFDAVPFYDTPMRQTNSLPPGDAIQFAGHYTFPDSNLNGISDSWEQHSFGSVSPDRTSFTDTDGDGVTDALEFLAGTNPTNSSSYLRFLNPVVQNVGTVRIDWPTVPGRSYRLSGSSNLVAWAPMSDWIRANGNVLSQTTRRTNGVQFFRVEARP